jgi:Tol biopolymer transport system component
MRPLAALLAAVVALAAAAGPAAAQDSDAPPGALPHWLPTEEWVYQHWLPFDEGRLYRLLRADRGAIWRHLRDDAAHDLEQLARRRGLTPRELARRLVPSGDRRLVRRALRVITQGHLSQHILFHSLHQTAVPRASRHIFGTPNATFLALRRAETSPLQIGRLHGRTTAQMHVRAVGALRAMARRGVRSGATSRRQARLLLARQVRQVPRWLGQSRYNGPPPTIGPKKALLPPADFANNPSISADGSVATWDAYRAKIPEARTRGEIIVRGAHLDEGTTFTVAGRTGTGMPSSAYNSALAAGGGAVVFEQAEGNLNFAKRYGEMRVNLRELEGASALPISHPDGVAGPSRTAYNPSVSSDGRRVAFQVTEEDGNTLWVSERDGGRSRKVGGEAVFEPRITGDGGAVVFTTASGRVLLREVATGATTLVSRGPAGPANAEAAEPAPSHDGTVVAFTSRASNLGAPGNQSRVFVREGARPGAGAVGAAARTVPISGGDTFAFEPSVSADGRFVAYAARPRPRAARGSVIRLHDRATARTTTISRGGYASEPAVSADGRRVVFTSTAAAPGKPAGLAGVFLRDVDAGTTRLLSAHTPVTAQAPPPRDDRPLLCPLARGHVLRP